MLNRPHAIFQWVKEYMPSIKEHFVLLAEPDHLLIRAPPLWATYNRPSAYPFFYIKPSEEKNAKIIQKYNPKDVPLKQFFPVGAFDASPLVQFSFRYDNRGINSLIFACACRTLSIDDF